MTAVFVPPHKAIPLCVCTPGVSSLSYDTPPIGLGSHPSGPIELTHLFKTLTPLWLHREVLGVGTATYEFGGEHSSAYNNEHDHNRASAQ